MTKNELRDCFKKARQDFVLSLDSESISLASQDVHRRLNDTQIVTGMIGGYAAMSSELDPFSILEKFREKGHGIALPWFADRISEMIYRISDGPLERGPFGIMQPDAENTVAEPDTVLVPLVAADRFGNRIGQGQGHFDRYLAKARATRPIIAIGLAWECQIADRLPADPWDEPLDYIVTPDRLRKVTS